MPYPNEHACRLKSPSKYSRFRRATRKSGGGKIYSVIYGIIRQGKSEEQAYRYNKSSWSASEARSHCSRHGGRFEAARGTSAQNSTFLSKIKSFFKGD